MSIQYITTRKNFSNVDVLSYLNYMEDIQMNNKFSAFRDKLTHAQAKRLSTCISVLIGLIFGIIPFVLFCHLIPNVGFHILLFFVLSALIGTAIGVSAYVFFFAPLFEVFYKKLDEENERAKKQLIEEFNLTKENYTKVNYSFEKILKDVPNKDICLAILTTANYSFYIKLVDEPRHHKDAFEIIIKDVNEQIVYQKIYMTFRVLQTQIEKAD